MAIERQVIILVCHHRKMLDAPPVIPLGRMVDYRAERRPQWLVITDEDVDGDREMIEQLTPGQSMPMHAERGGRVIDWLPMLYRDAEHGLVESPAPRRIVGAANGDSWAFDCPACPRSPEVNEATFGRLFDALVAAIDDPSAAGDIEFSMGQPVVDLSVLEGLISNTRRRKAR